MEETRKDIAKAGGALPALLADVTERVRYYARRSAGDMLELGRALTEAKELVPHGEWENYVRENAGMEIRTAQNFMQAFRKWGTGNPDLSKLNVGQMIALLPATDEEIEKISEDGDLSGMSSRQIKAAIAKARKEAKEEAEEEAQEKIRDAMQCAANGNARELAKQKERYEKTMDDLKIQLEAKKAEADELRAKAEQAEAVIQAGIEQARDVSAASNEIEKERRKFQQEMDEKDEMIRELQEQYDAVNQQYLDAQSALVKGDAERTNSDILSAAAVSEAVRGFIGQVGRIPYMHGAFATMDGTEREEYRANIMQVVEWARKSLEAMNTFSAEGGVI